MNKCIIKSIWCGDGTSYDPKYYNKVGTSYECLKKGIGAGMKKERLKNISKNSLQNIPYIGDTMEQRFKLYRILTTDDLKKEIKTMSKSRIQSFLQEILKNKDNKINGKAYNSVIFYLYTIGFTDLPKCNKL